MVTLLVPRRRLNSSIFATPLQAELLRSTLSLGTVTTSPRKLNEARTIDLLQDSFELANSRLAYPVSMTQVLVAAGRAKSLAATGKLTRLTLGRTQMILLDPVRAMNWKGVDSQRVWWGLQKSLMGRRWVPSRHERRPLSDLVAGLTMGDTVEDLLQRPTWLDPHVRLPDDVGHRVRTKLEMWVGMQQWSHANLLGNARPLRRACYPRCLLGFLPGDQASYLVEAWSCVRGTGGIVPGMWAHLSKTAQRVLVYATLLARIDELSRIVDDIADDQRAANDTPFWR